MPPLLCLATNLFQLPAVDSTSSLSFSLLPLPPPPSLGPYLFSDTDLGWESEEKKAVAGSRAWDVARVGNDEQQLLELEEEESDGSVRPLEDDSDEESHRRKLTHLVEHDLVEPG